MVTNKRKAVVNANISHLELIEELIDKGHFRSLSEFVREAMEEKLQRLQQQRLAEEVSRYCDAGHQEEDSELIASQAFDEAPSASRGRSKRRKKRAQG